MSDYGHDPQFGVFITPAAADADVVLELARLADVVGLDLVSFQDHPTRRRSSTPGRCCRSSRRRRPTSASRRTSPTCRCGRRSCSPAASRASTSSAAGGSSSASAPARSGTRSSRIGGPRLTPGEASTRWPRRSTSSGRSGPRTRPVRHDGDALPRRRRAAGPAAGARRRDLARRLQAADAARSPARRPTAGCRASATSSWTGCRR